MPKRAVQTLVYCLALGAAVFVLSLFTQGEHTNRLLSPALAFAFSGISIAIGLTVQGKKTDRECDERENFITEKAMKSSFYVMSFAVVLNWAYDFAQNGEKLFSIPLMMMILFWGSYGVAYGYYKLRS